MEAKMVTLWWDTFFFLALKRWWVIMLAAMFTGLVVEAGGHLF
jgi:hypothetical protein